MDNNIQVQNLCRQFDDFSLDNISFKVPIVPFSFLRISLRTYRKLQIM